MVYPNSNRLEKMGCLDYDQIIRNTQRTTMSNLNAIQPIVAILENVYATILTWYYWKLPRQSHKHHCVCHVVAM